MVQLSCAICLETALKRLKKEFPHGIPPNEISHVFDFVSLARSTTEHGKALCLRHFAEYCGVTVTDGTAVENVPL